MKIIVYIILLSTILAGCGLKKPLKLPDNPEHVEIIYKKFY